MSDVRLPKAVRQAGEAADKKMEELIAATKPVGEKTGVETPVQALDKETPQEPKPAAPQDPQEDFKQKYYILQGKYNAEIPQLSHQLRQLQSEIATLRAENQRLLTTPPEAPKVETPTALPAQLVEIRNQIAEEYDDRLADLMVKLAQTFAQQKAPAGPASDIVSRIDRLEVRNEKTEKERHWDFIDSTVPDWREININPEFHAWLDELDPLVGRTRQELLKEANDSLESRRVTMFFQLFKQHKAALASTQAPGRREKLEGKVTPQSQGGSASTPQDRKIYTRDEIKKFYDDIAKGKSPHSESEIERINRDITAAQAEGRIR